MTQVANLQAMALSLFSTSKPNNKPTINIKTNRTTYTPNSQICGTIHLTPPSSSLSSSSSRRLTINVRCEEMTTIERPDEVADFKARGRDVISSVIAKTFVSVLDVGEVQESYHDFVVDLPSNMARSISKKKGGFSRCNLIYFLRVRLEDESGDDDDVYADHEFDVVDPEEGKCEKGPRPVKMEKESGSLATGFLCGALPSTSGSSAKRYVEVDRTIFCARDVVTLSMPPPPKKDVLIQLREITQWKAEGRSEQTVKILTQRKIRKSPLPPHDDDKMEKVMLEVPSDASTSYKGKLIEVSHDIRIGALASITNVCSNDMVVPVWIEGRKNSVSEDERIRVHFVQKEEGEEVSVI